MAAPNSPADDIATYLNSAGIATIGASSGWSLSVSFEPNTPDTSVAIYDIGGLQPDAKWLIDWPQIQVRVRGGVNGYASAWAKAQQIKDALLGLAQVSIGGTLYVGIMIFGDINFIMYDEPNRPILTINFQIIREPSDETNRKSISA